MTCLQHRIRIAFAACALLTVCGASLPADAEEASPWVKDLRSAVRLIGGAYTAGMARAGIEIKLQPGWHTYWRYPGDSGVPPQFSFDGSENVSKVAVSFPAPHAYTDDAGTILGYKEDVVFPVQVTPKLPGKPVTLRMKIDYAVCEKLCVPVEATTELKLTGQEKSKLPILAEAEARVPKPLSAEKAGLSVKRVDGPGAKPRVLVDLPVQNDGDVRVFVEGPTAAWALPIPKRAQGAPAGRAYFTFNLDGLPPGTDPQKPIDLTFTVVRGDKAAEITTRLD